MLLYCVLNVCGESHVLLYLSIHLFGDVKLFGNGRHIASIPRYSPLPSIMDSWCYAQLQFESVCCNDTFTGRKG